MQTLIAYARRGQVLADSWDVRARARVTSYYGPWSGLDTHHEFVTGGIGLHLWEADDPARNWPAWHVGPDGLVMASLYAPLGEVAPHADGLARTVLEDPSRVASLTPPFVACVRPPGRQAFRVVTDRLGIGRLFRLETPDGWFLGNRPAALCLFAGVPARADLRAWRVNAATDWMMGRTTGYEGVSAVPPGSRLDLDPATGLREERTDLAQELATLPGDARGFDEALAYAVDSLQQSVTSGAAVWPGRPVVNLSGGRDSRVVAAAYISSGVEITLSTHDIVPGESDVAEHLVSLLDTRVDHNVRRANRETVVDLRDESRTGPSLLTHARQWHRFGEALRPSTYLWHDPPESLVVRSVIIGGAGGELAHGFYYPDPQTLGGWRDLGSAERMDAGRAVLMRRLVQRAPVTPASRRIVRRHVERVLAAAVTAGMDDPRMLDYFYAQERLRRWGGTGERVGIVSPLLAAGFVNAAFLLTPQQRLGNALHLALLRRMLPAWADVPFFSRPAQPMVPRRAATAADRRGIGEIIDDPHSWADAFEPEGIRELWSLSAAGLSSARDEKMLSRFIWRAGFLEHLREVNTGLAAQPSGGRAGIDRR